MARAVLFDMNGMLAFTEQFYNRRRVDYRVEKGFHFDTVPDFSGSNDRAIWEVLMPSDPELRERLQDGYRLYSDAYPMLWWRSRISMRCLWCMTCTHVACFAPSARRQALSSSRSLCGRQGPCPM